MEESRYIMRTEVLKKRGVLVEKTWDESKKMWHIAGPAILASVAQFSIGFVTVAFIGHLGDLQLAAVAIVQNVIEGFVYGVMKFFQSQGRVWVMTIISLVVLAIHVLLNWILVTKLGHGMAGAAIAANISWWLIIIAQMVYVVSGRFSESWTGFSFRAFKNLWGFIKLSLVSAVMLCLELWYFTTIVLMVGRLENPQVAVDSVSICMALQLWTLMVAIGFNAAVSVRVGNELGAGNSKAARFSMLVSITTSLLFGAIFASIILAARDHFPRVFTSKPDAGFTS